MEIEWSQFVGDGAFLSDVDAEDEIFFESIGGEKAEAVSLDASPK